MGKLTLYTGILLLGLIGCTEIPPVIHGDSGTTSPNFRKVLVEEFSGVFCQNCPAGTQFLENLKDNYHNRLIIVTIHAGFFARPYNESMHVFKTEETEALENFLGSPVAYPSATVNRVIPEGANSRVLNQNDWALSIDKQFQEEAGVDILLTHSWETNSRNLEISTTVKAVKNVETPLYLSVFIIEDQIIDPQNTPEGVVLDYQHNHVLRDVITPISGALLVDSWTINQQEQREFSLRIPENWNAKNLNILAFVHENGESLKVWQAELVKLIN